MPDNHTQKSIHCPVCLDTSCDLLQSLDISDLFQEYAKDDAELHDKLLSVCEVDADAFDMYCCRNCGLQFCDPLKEPGAEWYMCAYNNLGLHASGRWEFDYIANALEQDDIVGEVGCGTGVFLGQCSEKGIEAEGLDFAEVSVNICRSKGLNASVMSVSSERGWSLDTDSRKNVVVSYHVLEHLADPGGLLRLAHDWAVDDATLWIAVPSNRRLDIMMGSRDYLDEPPHHLTKWTPKALGLVGSSNGWSLRRVVYEPIGIRQRLWGVCVNGVLYKKLREIPMFNSKLMERALRYALYPFIILRHGITLWKMSGFSMLAEYRKSSSQGDGVAAD